AAVQPGPARPVDSRDASFDPPLARRVAAAPAHPTPDPDPSVTTRAPGLAWDPGRGASAGRDAPALAPGVPWRYGGSQPNARGDQADHGSLSLGSDSLRGGGGPGESTDLSLHGLPDPHGHRVSRDHSRHIRQLPDRRRPPEHLHQDRREREPPR